MVQTAHSLDPVKPGANLMSIDPKNWHRFPLPITKAMTDPIYIPTITYTGGVVNEGANSDNNGETGTLNSTDPTRGQGWMTQAEKATALGTTIAPDVTKSYGTKARGAIGPRDPYPTGG